MLVDLLANDAVPMTTLEERYGSVLRLVRKLIGVVPNCDPYLEIWPTAFKSYNVMVPNLLNLPISLFGGPRRTMGLAMYAASREAGCAYCSAHTCSFALRRGAAAGDVASSMDETSALAPADAAAVRVGRALAQVPSSFTASDRAALERHFSADDAEWIVLSIAMMGWLNKMMDALGVPLELSTAAEVNGIIAASGWTPGQHLDAPPPNGAPPEADTFFGKLGVLRDAPRAIALDRAWTKGVPDRWPEVGAFLRAATGHDFPLLSRLRHRRAVRAIATMIKDNVPASRIAKADKLAAGLIFAEVVGDASLGGELETLGAAAAPDSPVLVLARAASSSPAVIDADVVAQSRTIEPAAIVELLAFLSLLQLLHRLGTYHAAA